MAQSTRELNVNINVDITETIRGLKAIQREAKKAAQALRELEAAVDAGTVQLTGEPDMVITSGTISAGSPEDARKIADKLAKAVSDGGK
ncbi:hypothetical protein JNUCC32_31465 (plasmid) [Paenibacillus sp. JNUCC32]|uniref:hypothetical protein n=1 Tax=Paenibacillus sp. JNUCC32 TaxID=2777984 RepID=UPI0017882CDA|nr:hypothetical protein [Paenibacillus sp. JNUCC-32]QOT13716.1 hypothetical protein JNUCC32_31465 [Paenibacillus sp. JNUCC-32]